MPDRYHSFAELAAAEAEGSAYAIRLVDRASPVVVMAPHGGWIEPTTSLVTTAIAADRHSLYCFEGLDPHRAHADLHLTSTRFDEPGAAALVARAKVTVTVHGYLEPAPSKVVLVGGLDTELLQLITHELTAAGFANEADGHRFPATDPANICNRTTRRAGVQLELPSALRDYLRDNVVALQSFAAAINRAIESLLATMR